jgi:tetratricopeptide (TPR) repeat protein
MASEIAIADFLGAKSKLPKIARLALERGMPPSDATELASALGSLEAAHGSDRAARRLLRQAVKGANENSVAQIRWLNRAHLGEAVDVSSAKPPLLHEANAWALYYKGEFKSALDESLSWLTDQPFSSAPAILSSFILEDLMWEFEAAREIAVAGLKSNPSDSMLLNNLAVCLMELGRIGEAEAVLGHLRAEDRTSNSENTFRATFGMLEFRKGNVNEGRKLYDQAIERASALGDKADAVRALFHLLFEEIRSETDKVQDTLNRLTKMEDRNEVVETPRHLMRMRQLLDDANRN